MARLEADTAAGNAESSRWESALYGAFGGLFVVVAAFAVGFVVTRRKESISNDQVSELGTNRIDVSGQAQHGELPIEVAAAEALLERELEKQVAAINATQGMIDGKPQNVSAPAAPDVDPDGLTKAIDPARARERVQAEEIKNAPHA
jgi:NAD/NADP transhydrogenase alpha subunit